MRVVIHDYSGHPGQVHLSRELARRGHDVEHQFCSSYITGRGPTERREGDPESFEVRAVVLPREFARYSPLLRLKQELQYARLAAKAILAARPDVAMLSNIPLISLFLVAATLRIRRVPYVFWWQDVYSHAIGAVARQRLGPVGAVVAWLAGRVEREVARGSARIVAITDSFLEQLDTWNLDRSKAEVIPNWGAIDEVPTRPRNNPWAKAHGLVDVPVVMYAGTLGLKHDPSVIVRLAEMVPQDCRVVVVSQGRGREWLEKEAADTPQLLLLDYQPYEDLPDMLATADVLLLVLEPDASHYSVPSKVLNYLCAARPVLALLPAKNAVTDMIKAADAGTVIAPSDTDAVSAAVNGLLSDPARRESMGRAARRYAEQTFDVRFVGDRFESILCRAYDRSNRCT